MYCSIQHCSKCVIALWFSVWGEEIAQMTAKSQQQRWWELWVQEQKKHGEIQTHAEEWAGEAEVMGKPAFSLLVTVMKSNLGDWTRILGADVTSPACVTLYWSDQMPLFGWLLLSDVWLRSYRLWHQEISIWVPQSQFCRGLGATRWWWQELNSTDTVDPEGVTNPQSRVFSWGWTYLRKSCNVEQLFSPTNVI